MSAHKTSLFIGFEGGINACIDSQNHQNAKYYSWDDFRSYVLKLSWLLDFSAMENATLKVYSLQTLKYPLLMQCVLFWITRQSPKIIDDKGLALTVTLKSLTVATRIMFSAFLSRKALIGSVLADLSNLSMNNSRKKKILANVEQAVIYCRTDLWFGLKSGGSIGHISGVLNNFKYFCRAPLFFTTDVIPTVSKNIPTYILEVDQKFSDFSELPSLASNRVFLRQAVNRIGDSSPSFIYQRYSLNNYLGLQLSDHFQVPLVLEYNGSEIWIARHWGSPLKYEAISEKIEDANLSISDIVVVVSSPMKQELIARKIDAEKILVNPNGVDPQQYSPNVDGTKVRNKYCLDDKLVIGFIGTFGRWHGAEVLAEAFGELLKMQPMYKKHLHLMMIGDGMTLKQVKDIVARNNLDANCTFTGIVPQVDGPSYLAACDILASPHIPNADGTPFFGSPTKLFEYMAMGKAIIASNLDQIGDVLKHNQSAWMVRPGDVEELTMGLERLIGDSNLRDRLGRAARDEVIAKYTWLEHTRRIIEKLEERCGD